MCGVAVYNNLQMDDLRRVNSVQLYTFWKNLSLGLLVIIALMAFSHILPFYASPIIAFLAATVLYTMLYNNKMRTESGCLVIVYTLLYCVVNYTIVTVVLSILTMWHFVSLPKEFLFLNDPYISSLLMNPVCLITCIVLYFRRRSIGICRECRLSADGLYERGKAGSILRYEAYFQIRNLIYLFGFLTVAVWAYYEFIYIKLSLNSRDYYVFTWLNIISFVLDELYFVARYYNLYLDLKENDEIITQEELQDMTAKTYLRYYVIYGDKIYLDPKSIVAGSEYKEVLDTPFVTKRSVNGIPIPEVRSIIRRLTGSADGELRFFYGRRSAELKNHSVLRYFYFLDGRLEDYQDMPVDGEWVDFEDVKRFYTHTPGKFAPMAVGDISRLATIILTEKMYDENGRRKVRLKSYSPTFTLEDVRNSALDFQDDKWIKISMFNSDTPFYRVKKLFRGKPKVR